MTTQRRRFLRLCGVAGIGAVAGCSDSSGDGTPTADQATSTTTETESPVQDRTQQARLLPDDGDNRDDFGVSVTLSSDGTTALVGAKKDEDPNGEEAGSAYVFDRSGGSWTQQAKLLPDDGDSGDWFGESVALSSDGTTALIGAPKNDFPNDSGESILSGEGSAYVFDRAGGSWTQQAKLTPDYVPSMDGFGISVALSSDGATALVGAYHDEDPNTGRLGADYVFDRSGGSWTQQAKLAPDDVDSDDEFGGSVTLSGDGATALIGADTDSAPNGENSGSAYVFASTGDSWTEQAKLVPDDGDSDDFFGNSVTLSSDGGTALIGADSDSDPNGDGAGSAYVFDRSGDSWTQQAKLAPDDGDEYDSFGNAVTLSSDGATALVGAGGDEDPNGTLAGSAYVFGRSGNSWTQQAKVALDDGEESDHFGASVALSRDGATALIGARGDKAPYGNFAGSAYVFE